MIDQWVTWVIGAWFVGLPILLALCLTKLNSVSKRQEIIMALLLLIADEVAPEAVNKLEEATNNGN